MATQWFGTSLVWKRTYLPYIFSSWDCDCWHGFRTTDIYFFQNQELWVTTSDWWKKYPKINDNISQKFWLHLALCPAGTPVEICFNRTHGMYYSKSACSSSVQPAFHSPTLPWKRREYISIEIMPEVKLGLEAQARDVNNRVAYISFRHLRG